MDHVISFEEQRQNNSSMSDSASNTSDSTVETVPKKNLLPLKIICLVFVLLVSLGWIGIIVLLILKEEWQLVMVAWLLLYAAAHFCYWYCRRHSDQHTTFRQRLMARLRGSEQVATASQPGDSPPSYEDLVKSELPPPTYSSVVGKEPSKLSRVFHLHSLPWFLKKKSLEQSRNVEAGVPSASSDEVVVVVGKATNYSGVVEGTCGVPSISLTIGEHADDDLESSIDLPSYEFLMRENALPVMTPIHKALANLPKPPPYSSRPMDAIPETQQQQQQQNE